MTEFEKYFTAIYDGRITACKKMRLQSERLLNALVSPDKYHFDIDIANKHIDFIERFCCYPSGEKMGKPFTMELFQKARLQALFGFVDDNNKRQYNECLIIEGRKNGKTSETGAVEIDMLCNDGEGSPQIYNLATQREQATLGFNACYKMIQKSPFLRKHIRKRASDLYFSYNFGYIKALASETANLDGLDVHCAVIDELAAIKNRDLYDLIKQAMGARSQPVLFTITTNGFVRNGIFDAQYEYAEKVISGKIQDEHFLPFIYELDSPDEWEKEDCWIKANPGLGTIKSYDYLRQMVSKAKADPTFKPTVLVKDFNMKENPQSRWLTYEEAYNGEKIPEYSYRYFIGGMDAADSVDLNAAVAIFQKPGDDKIYVKSMFWIPQSVIDEQDEKGSRDGRDHVPYKLWIEQGLMRAYPGAKVDKRVFLDWLCELRDNEDIYPMMICYDPWHISDDLLRAFENEFGKKTMRAVRQGVITLSSPMKDLKADLKEHRIVYDDNPILLWCLLNTDVKADINGNIQPCKSDKSTQRIDGTAALLDAYVGYCDEKDNYLAMI
ncbi:MAG: terminase large subunit [Clostridia bacterium]|nr:terminase large subunit [Clostridia bacterium]